MQIVRPKGVCMRPVIESITDTGRTYPRENRRFSASSTFCWANARTRLSSSRISFRKSDSELAFGKSSNSEFNSWDFEKCDHRGSDVERPTGRYAACKERAWFSGPEFLWSGDFDGDLAISPLPFERSGVPGPRLVLGLPARWTTLVYSSSDSVRKDSDTVSDLKHCCASNSVSLYLSMSAGSSFPLTRKSWSPVVGAQAS